jgi:hypothetical protein
LVGAELRRNDASVLRLRVPGKDEFDLPTFRAEARIIKDDDIPFDPLADFA